MSILCKKLRSVFLIITTTARAACSQRWSTTLKYADFTQNFSTFDAAGSLKYKMPPKSSVTLLCM